MLRCESICRLVNWRSQSFERFRRLSKLSTTAISDDVDRYYPPAAVAIYQKLTDCTLYLIAENANVVVEYELASIVQMYLQIYPHGGTTRA